MADFGVFLQAKMMNRMNQPDEKKLMARLQRRFQKGVTDYGLIDEGDRILIGLSGGKDSLALAELLARRARVWKPRFEVIAVHVAMTNIGYRTDTGFLAAFCQGLGIPFRVAEATFDATGDTRKSPCFLCSWNRRKALFTLAQEAGCNKIALGHHMDDILETMLMNLTYQGAFSTMPPLLRMKKFPLSIIRPLCLVHEEDIAQLSVLRGWPGQLERCPYEHDSGRAAIKDILHRLEELNPEARYSMWGAMTNVQNDLLPHPKP